MNGILVKKQTTEDEKMPAKRYRVTLTEEERAKLSAIVKKGKGNARRMTRSRILLLADEQRSDGGWKDADIVQALGVSQRTVERTREKCVELGVEAALNHTRPHKKRKRFWTVLTKPAWCNWRAARPPMAVSTGLCKCWQTS